MDGERQERGMHFHSAQAVGPDAGPAAAHLRGSGEWRETVGEETRGDDGEEQVLLEEMYNVKQHLHKQYVNSTSATFYVNEPGNPFISNCR